MCLVVGLGHSLQAQGTGAPGGDDDPRWEVTAASREALERGLQWLAANQGEEGNWGSNDLGLVAMGTLAFLAAGHVPGRGKYSQVTQRSIDYVVDNARPSGLLNISSSQRDMYNHGLATFVLGQVHGMTRSRDSRLTQTLDRGLKLIANTQCDDGGWDYEARRQAVGHDLSLVVMQAKALRSAVDSGLDVPPEVIDQAIHCVRSYYSPRGPNGNSPTALPEAQQRNLPGRFTYEKRGGGETTAMAAAGVVCLQEFGQYDDWRIRKNMQMISGELTDLPGPIGREGKLPVDAYTLYYVSQALYQVGNPYWKRHYGDLRDYVIKSQIIDAGDRKRHGSWVDVGARGGGRVGGQPGKLYATSVACFLLAIPNRFLPILQEGRIESFENRFGMRP